MTPPFSLSGPITQLKGIGPSLGTKLSHLGIFSPEDLLRHFPARYLDFTQQITISQIQAGQTVSFLARLSHIKTFFTKNQKLLTQATATDATGQITLTWFNNPYLKHLISDGHLYSLAGQATRFGSSVTIIAPAFEEGDSFGINTKGLVPVYSQTAGISSKWLRQKISKLLDTNIKDPLSLALRRRHTLISLNQALRQIHFPQTKDQWRQADKRLSFNEHLRINLLNYLDHLRLGHSVSLKVVKSLDYQTQKSLPWALTPDQQKTVLSIYQDLGRTDFTHRLVQGDTGSGKTATLIFAANQCLSQGLSCAIMAPTELLANQHYHTFKQFCLYPEKVALITARTKPSSASRPTLFIGTQALLHRLKPDQTPPLAFVAIDEQHKFGVEQRHSLLQRSPMPHLINLSATPIPRTVALGLLGDIQVSTIKHRPTNRLPTKTYVLSPAKFRDSPPWLIKQLSQGHQIFVVCPTISHSKTISSVENMTKIYRQMLPPQFPVWTIHGQLKPNDQQNLLSKFKKTPASVLVATSLIEVGIDIPEANIMIVHSAERFGLAQLHQLRGRVGRGGGQGHCFLVSSTNDGVEIERLQLLKKYHSGLTLAKKDLRLRGAGEIFGLKQHGALPTRLHYFWSKKLFAQAKNEAKRLIKDQSGQADIIARRLITW